MKYFNNTWRYYAIVIAIGILLFIPYLGNVRLFDWDEINFAEAAREMLVTGDWLTVRIDYQPFHEKPPLFFWLQAISMSIFGVGEFAARLPNAITGIFTLIIVFSIGKRLYDERFGLIWVLAYIGSFLPHFYFRSGLIDPLFNLFIFLSIVYWVKFYQINIVHNPNKNKGYGNIAFASCFAALAMLTKGPVGFLLILILSLFLWLFTRKQIKFPLKQLLLFTILSYIIPVLWYIVVSVRTGSDIFSQFAAYHIRLLTSGEAGHGGPFYYHFIVLLLGCFPASILTIRSFRNNPADDPKQKIFKQSMLILLAVVLVIFSIVETKIVHYSSLAYFPITFLATYAIYHIAYRGIGWKPTTSWLLGIFGYLIAVALIAFPLLLMNIDLLLPYITDKFTYEILKSRVGWGGYEFGIGVVYLIAITISLILFHKRKLLQAFILLFGGTAITIFLFLPMIAPKIEAYTQSAPIEFYKSLAGRDCFVVPVGFKSYAHLFYSRKPFELSPGYVGIEQGKFEEWLLCGAIGKPAFFVAQNKDAENYIKKYDLTVLYSKNGFVFLYRPPVKL